MEQAIVLRDVQLDPSGRASSCDLVVVGDPVEAVGKVDTPAGAVVCDLGSARIVPGLVDLQVNGFAGAEVYDATADSLRKIVREIPRTGCTSVLLTMISAPRAKHDALFDALEAFELQGVSGARVLGRHLEGPYLSPGHAGAHPPEALRLPDTAEARELLDRSGGRIKLWTIAPELPGGAELSSCCSTASSSPRPATRRSRTSRRSAGSYAASRSSTHLFNAMTPFHHRRRDFRRLLDSRFVAGMPGRLEGGVVRRPDGRLAGSAVPALGLVRNLATSGAPPTVEAFEAMSRRPGDLLGRADLGGLEPGAFADLPGFDGDGTLGETWVGGRRLYAKEAGWFVV